MQPVLSSSFIASRGWTAALLAWLWMEAPVVDADCVGVCICVCVCVCSRMLYRWRNCQESVICSGRLTLGRRSNMKYYKPLFCLITSESLALKCSLCGLWHVLWEAHSCGASLNFISKRKKINLWRLWNNCMACWYDIISLSISGEK